MGVEVHATGDPVWDLFRHSRYCASFTRLGNGLDERLDWLERWPHRAVLLPCDDNGLELVARHRARLVELGHVPVEANDEVLLAMLDKHRTYELAAAVGVPAPRTVTVRGEDDAERAVQEIGFPCALKPLHSHLFARVYGPHKKVWIVEDAPELRENLARMVALELEMLVTEILPGRDDQYVSYYSYLDERGEPLFHFTKRKLRQYPIRFGLACYQVTTLNREVMDLGLRFFQGIGLRGIGNVEFKRDPRDGRFKLIECNHRFTAANELVRLAGIDVARLAYSRLAGTPAPRVDSFREGIYMWHAAEDVRALLDYRRSGELTVGAWARSLLHRQHFPVLARDDPRPAVLNYRRMLGRLLS